MRNTAIPSISRRALLFAAGAAAVNAWAQPDAIDGFPTRPVRLVVPAPPGGPADLASRAVAEAVRGELGQVIVVDNRPGAAGMLGTQLARQAAPDGYTLVLSAPSSQITAPLLTQKPLFDGARDFTAIGQFASFTGVLLVSSSVPAQNVMELVAYVRQRPGKLNYGSAGTGSNPHLLGELLKLRTGTYLVHIPYRGGAPALQALVNDEVQIYFDAVGSALPWIRNGRVRALGVVSAKRSPLLPDVPTLMEQKIFDAPADLWMGLAAPPGLPHQIVRRLNQALVEASSHSELTQFLDKVGGHPAASSPEAFQALWVTEQKRWAEVIRTNNIHAG